MFLAHSFRLRHPWDQETGETCDFTRWSRGFHKPTGLEPSDRMWLVVSGLPAGCTVVVNEQELPAPAANKPGQYEVTELLGDTNRIEITVPAEHEQPVPFPYDVRLGIVGCE
ncbi:hypothetical protein [Adhaeretor mobilis]|uniref:Uncharacterized protein n=1 Tax=Adhaeretor mobilis TaxID=1930276 RepID=A0A517MYV8_9BACT|nr:hypothetical protein [Adhaeretor mobilis]QDT00071.1 hypothetical protein HG15A2_34060 [Adhaeretor mobilis]